MADTYKYAFTLRKTTLPVWITDYEHIMDRWRDNVDELEFHYEETSGLHIHGMITNSRKVYIKNHQWVHPGPGWNLDFKIVEDEEAWVKYILKEAHAETNLINKCYSLLSDLKNTWERFT